MRDDDSILNNFNKNINIIGALILLFLFIYMINGFFYHVREYKKNKVENYYNLKNIKMEKSMFYNNLKFYIALSEKTIKDEKLKKLISNLNNENIKDIENILYGVQKILSCENIYIMDKNGEVIISVDKNFYNNNYSFRPYFQNGLKGEVTVYPALGITTNERGIYIGMPFYIDNEISYVFSLKLNTKLMEEVLYSLNEKIFVVSEENIIFFSNENSAIYKYIDEKTENEINNLYETKQFSNQKLTKYEYNFSEDNININGKKYKQIKKDIEYGWKTYIYYDIEELSSLKNTEYLSILSKNMVNIFLFFIFLTMFIFYKILLKKDGEKNELLQIIDKSPISMIIVNDIGIITYANEKIYDLTGYEKYEIIGKNVNIFNSEYQTDKIDNKLWNKIKNGEIWSGKLFNKRKNGTIYLEKMTIVPINTGNGFDKFLAIKEDSTENQSYITTISNCAKTDKFTGIYHRSSGFIFLEKLINQSKISQNKFTLCFIGIDDIKYANKAYGYKFGDNIIKEFVKVVKENLNDDNIFFRASGDEFIILFPRREKSDVIGNLNSILTKYSEIITDKGHPYIYSATYGCSEYDSARDINSDILVQEASKEMYDKKEYNKNN